MSKENLEQFMNQVAKSEELQTRIGAEIDTESLIALGAECGCAFTAEDLQESTELSDEELDGVSGGVQRVPDEARWGLIRIEPNPSPAPRFGYGRIGIAPLPSP